MGEQIHIGGLTSSMDLARRAGIAEGTAGVDLCCCTGAGMRFLVRFRGVARMMGVDATEAVVAEGRRRCQVQGMADRIEFTLADACDTGLATAAADFVWGEDAWCYVADKPRLIAEAARLVRSGGVVAFTDWVEGPVPMEAEEGERMLTFMKFPSFLTLDEYGTLLTDNGCHVEAAENTGRFAPCVDLYIEMLTRQLTFDALRILDFDQPFMESLACEMAFMQQLAREEKMIQGLFVARKR